MRKKRQKQLTGLNQIFMECLDQKNVQNKNNQNILPLIHYKSYEKGLLLNSNQGILSLQVYISQLLKKSKQRESFQKRYKMIQEKKLKQAQFKKKTREQQIKQQQKNKFKLLKQKLFQLKREMELEQKKLQLEHSYQEMINKKEQKLYDKLYERYGKKNVTECAINTDIAQIKIDTQKQKQDRNQSLIINKNLQQNLSNSKQIRNSQKNLKNKRKHPLSKKDLKKKFRIAALAVFFTIVFPKYSQKFYHKRKQYFSAQVTISNINFEVQNIYKLLNSLDLRSIISQIQAKNKNIGNLPQVDFQQLDSDDQQSKITFKIDNISQILITLLKKIRQAISTAAIHKLFHILSQLLLTKSFVLSDFFLKNQLFRLKFHEKYYTLKLSIQQQMILIANFILLKMIGFQFLINNSKEINQDEEKNYLFQKQQINQTYNASERRQLLLAGVYLTELCNQINFKDQIQEQSCFNGNIQQISKFFLPMNQLQYQNDLQYQNQESSKQTIQSNIVDTNFLNPKIKVKQITVFDSVIKGVRQNKIKQSQILKIIIDIRKELYKLLKKGKKQVYQRLKQELYEKNIPSDNIKQQSIQLQPDYLQFFKIQRQKYRKQHSQFQQKLNSSTQIYSQKQRGLSEQTIEKSLISEDNGKQNLNEKGPKHDLNLSKKRFSNNNSAKAQNRQRLFKKLHGKKQLLKMSNQQFSSGKSIN